MIFDVLAAGFILVVSAKFIEVYTFCSAHDKVNDRLEKSSWRTCGVKRTFYGWRVIEYAECDL